MADGKLGFELVSPERLLFSAEVEMVVVPGEEGDFGVLPRHAAMLSTLRPGVISIYETERHSRSEQIFVAGGFAEVTPERCTVLAEDAAPLSALDRAEVQQELQNAREDLEDAKDEAERKAATSKLAVVEAKLKALG